MWPLWGVILQRFIPSDRDGGHEEANMQTAVTGLLGWLPFLWKRVLFVHFTLD